MHVPHVGHPKLGRAHLVPDVDGLRPGGQGGEAILIGSIVAERQHRAVPGGPPEDERHESALVDGVRHDLDAGRMLVTGVFAALALIGTLVGARTASRARPEVLRRVFGFLVLGVGVYTGIVAFV